MATRHAPAAVLQAARSIGLLESDAARAAAALRLFSTEADMARIVGAIHQEPGLTARVLRVANSAYYGQRGGVASVHRAVSVLGLNVVRAIAATGCFDHAISRRLAGACTDWAKVKRHSLSTAILAEHFAAERCSGLRELAFTAGLIHDLGIVIEGLLDPSALEARVESLPPANDASSLNALHAHASYAAIVAQHWDFPSQLVAAIEHHHDDMDSSASSPSLSVLLRSATDTAARLGYGHDLEAPPIGSARGDDLGMTRERLDSLADLVQQRIAGIAGDGDG